MEKMNGLELYREIKKIDNKVKVCFLAASKFNYEVDVLSDLRKINLFKKQFKTKI